MPLLLPLLAACDVERGVRPASDEVTYSGWVHDTYGSDEVLSDGPVTFSFPNGDAVEADQPYDAYPGYWSASHLSPSTPFQLRVEGADAYPSVWAGDTPGSDGTWLNGYLFAAGKDWVDGLIAGLDLPLDQVPGSLDEGAIHVIGVPLDGSDWDCAAVRVQGTAPVCFATNDDGTTSRVSSGPFSWFFVHDLEAGDIEVEDGFGGVETYTAQEGDLVMAFWLVHG